MKYKSIDMQANMIRQENVKMQRQGQGQKTRNDVIKFFVSTGKYIEKKCGNERTKYCSSCIFLGFCYVFYLDNTNINLPIVSVDESAILKILLNHDLYKMGEYNSEKKKISGVVERVKNCWIFDIRKYVCDKDEC